MLFNSEIFIFLFLPLTLLATHLAQRLAGRAGAVAALNLASWIFYGYWDWRFLPLLWGSILFNFQMARLLQACPEAWRRWLLAFGIIANLGVLGFFKYAGFFAENLAALTGQTAVVVGVALPLGISFITFQKIAFLVDVWRERPRPYALADYALFVSFFPQLIAGPIVHHRELIPQLARPSLGRLRLEDLAIGVTIFSIGLIKKTLLADSAALYANPVFEAAALAQPLGAAAAWQGALAYALQLYFDFSGYSDMAIGLGWLFGIRLPINFASPYKATSIIDFWRRWHITLSRFLRDYLYLPLGGSRQGPARRYFNLLLVMLLGGLWHGAGWTFVLWGGLHGLYLVLNHAWRGLAARFGLPALPDWLAWGLTLLAVVIAWVPFRAVDLAATGTMLGGMAGLNGLADPLLEPDGVLLVLTLLALAAIAPSTQEIMRTVRPAAECLALTPVGWSARLLWQPSRRVAVLAGVIAALALTQLWRTSEFLYFQF